MDCSSYVRFSRRGSVSWSMMWVGSGVYFLNIDTWNTLCRAWVVMLVCMPQALPFLVFQRDPRISGSTCPSSQTLALLSLGYFQEDMITHCKLELFPTRVCITLLPTLCREYPLSYYCVGNLYQLRPQQLFLAYLLLEYRSSTPSPI